MTEIISIAITVFVLVFASIVHEVSHGYVALLLGDPTAKNAGRLTLNPKSHIHPFGSIILPFLMALSGGAIFGFANPVPYTRSNLKHPYRDGCLIALAGPISNLLQAGIAALLLRFLLFEEPAIAWMLEGPKIDGTPIMLEIIQDYLFINCALFAFNILPLPPLDGASIISLILPDHLREKYDILNYYALPILMLCVFILPSILNFDILSLYTRTVINTLLGIFLG